MKIRRNRLNEAIISVFNSRILFSFIVSLISCFIILFQIINLNISGFIAYFSSIFTILFLPFYPLFFILFRSMKINLLEKLALTIILNLSFYILVGYFGSLVGFIITANYFLILVIITYLITFLYSIIKLNNSGYQGFLIIKKNSANYSEFCNNFSLLRFLRKKVSINSILLVIFLTFICLFNLFSASVFLGTDSWLHVSIIRFISEMNIIPYDEYFGAMGLHIYSAVFHFFSGMDILLIPKYFVIYTIPISTMILYIILKRIFKNQNLAIFGVFILEFSSLGFGGIMHLFWPESLAILQGLTIFFILYLRISEFVKSKTITKEKIIANMVISYGLIIIIFLSALMTHSLVSIILLISFMWVFLIFFLKDFRRGIDFIILCVLIGIFLIFYSLNIGTGHFLVFSSFGQLPIFYYFLLILGMIIILFPIIRKFYKIINFGDVDFFELDSQEFKKYQDLESKIIIPLSFIIVSFLSIIFMIGNFLSLNLDIISAITAIEIFIFAFFAVWGFIIFQQFSHGRILFIW
ncbi:MAG: hypothetical protein KGD57_01015, partial [Candidatus Lokiarchaeota archaeon]|nr:hypothetical protein [Candidatus Lokiarchaeota archaeon]